MPRPRIGRIPTTRCWCILAAACLIALWIPLVSAQDETGCEGVGFAKHSPAQYSPQNLRKRLERNPADVDALINLGIHLEEQDQITQADALYQRAIEAKPDCYLGYLFAGLVESSISGRESSKAEAKIRKAISLDRSLRNDPNVQSFLKSHPLTFGGPPAKEVQAPSLTGDLLGSANTFLIGVGVGLLLAMPFLYLARRKPSASG